MRSATLQGTLQNLRIVRLFNRTHTSNNNAFAESIFKTLKYCPKYTVSGFNTIYCVYSYLAPILRLKATE